MSFRHNLLDWAEVSPWAQRHYHLPLFPNWPMKSRLKSWKFCDISFLFDQFIQQSVIPLQLVGRFRWHPRRQRASVFRFHGYCFVHYPTYPYIPFGKQYIRITQAKWVKDVFGNDFVSKLPVDVRKGARFPQDSLYWFVFHQNTTWVRYMIGELFFLLSYNSFSSSRQLRLLMCLTSELMRNTSRDVPLYWCNFCWKPRSTVLSRNRISERSVDSTVP